jgi:hypothetical protein
MTVSTAPFRRAYRHWHNMMAVRVSVAILILGRVSRTSDHSSAIFAANLS